MASPNPSVKQRLRAWLAGEQPAAITEEVWSALLQRLSPVSESYLRDLLRATGLPFAQPYCGIRQHTFEELEQSLRGMLDVYTAAMAAGNRQLARYCRKQVIAAKDRARFQARRGSVATGKAVRIPARWGARIEAGRDPVPARVWTDAEFDSVITRTDVP